MKALPDHPRLYIRGQIYWFRAKVPKDISPLIGKREIKYSLKAKSKAEAIQKLHAASKEADQKFASIRAQKEAELPPDIHSVRELRSEDIERMSMTATPARFASHDWNAGLARGNWSRDINVAVDRMLKKHGFIVPTTAPPFAALRNRLAEMFAPPVPLSAAFLDADDYPKDALEEIINRFRQEREDRWCDKTKTSNHVAFRALREVLGDNFPVARISPKEIEKVVRCLRDLPPNISTNPNLHGLQLAQAAHVAKQFNLGRLSASSARSYINNIKGFCRWAVKNRLLKKNPFDTFNPDIGSHASRPEQRAFTLEELDHLFAAPVFTGCRDDRKGFATPGKNHPKRGRFWVPLISLYSGLRLHDACALTKSAVKPVEDGYVLHVDGKSCRLPLLLRDLGFDDLLENASGRLFPELTRGADGYFSGPFSKWFRRLIRSCALDSRRLSFSSLNKCYDGAKKISDIAQYPGLDLSRLKG